MTSDAVLAARDRRVQPPNPAGAGGYALGLPAAVLLLYMMVKGFTVASCLWALAVIVVPALAIWRYQSDRILFERRAILATVARPTGRLWRWFWQGRIAIVSQVFVSGCLAALLLCVLVPLQPLHWWVLAGDAMLIALVIPWVRRLLAANIKDGYIGLVARRWPLEKINTLLVVAGFVYVDFAVLGWPDKRDLPWTAVLETTFLEAQQTVVCPAFGVAVGAVEAVAAMGRDAAARVIPNVDGHSTKVVAWLLFLIWAGFGAFLYTKYLLGVVALMDRIGGREAGSDDRTTRAFVYTILALAIPVIFANIKYEEWRAGLPWLPEDEPSIAPRDPCADFVFDTDRLTGTLDEEVQRARADAKRLGTQTIDASLDHAFSAAEAGVDQYLDWYYSMLGDYSRLAAVVTNDIGQFMTDKLRQFVIEQSGFHAILVKSSSDIEQQSSQLMERTAETVGTSIQAAVQASTCPLPDVDLGGLIDLERDKLRGTVATATGGGVTAKLLLTKPATAMAGKLAAKGSVQLAGKALAKVAVKKGASAIASATVATVACSGLGPVAIACGVGAGLVTWLTVDKVVLEVDEIVNRDTMRAELLGSLKEQRAELRQDLVRLHDGLVDLYATEIQSAANRVFLPARDGM